MESTPIEQPAPKPAFVPLVYKKHGVVYDYSAGYEITTDPNTEIVVRSIKSGTSRRLNQAGQLNLTSKNLVTTDTAAKSKPTRMLRVYQLWMLMFSPEGAIDEAGEYKTVDHLDRNHANNVPTNLRWATSVEQSLNRDKWTKSCRWIDMTDQSPDIVNEYKQFMDTGLYVSRSAEVIKKFTTIADASTWKKRTGAMANKEGYVTLWDKTKSRSFNLNRVVAHLWPSNQDLYPLKEMDDLTLVVDHLDHIKTNNHRDNLRVCTQKENSQATHDRGFANQFTRAVTATKVLDVADVFVRQFQNTTQAGNALGLAQPNVRKAILKNGTAGGYAFRYATTHGVVPKKFARTPINCYKVTETHGPVYCCFFDSILNAAKVLDVNSGSISNVIARFENRKHTGGWRFEYTEPVDSEDASPASKRQKTA
jgi:hypothetical protein